MNLIPVRRGCGSWECRCRLPHSFPFKISGKCGSVTFEGLPGPRGLGLVAGKIAETILRLAGIKDCWTRSYGSTSTLSSTSFAVFDTLKSTYRIVSPSDWTR
jgi:small subunit ribosomal protein S5